MDGKNEKRVLHKKEAVLFVGAMCIYVLVYIGLYLFLTLINAVGEVHPYIMLAGMILLFFLSAFLTRRILRTPFVRSLLG